jgi:hypothetical protein
VILPARLSRPPRRDHRPRVQVFVWISVGRKEEARTVMQSSETAAGKEGCNEFTVDWFDLRPGERMREGWFPVLWRKG